jgi:hypothetical protein
LGEDKENDINNKNITRQFKGNTCSVSKIVAWCGSIQ